LALLLANVHNVSKMQYKII